MVKEYELMREDNTSSVLEELEESKNRTKALEEILDDVECQRNTLPSQIQPKMKRKIQQKRDSWDLNASMSQPMSLVLPRVLLSNKYKLSHSVSQTNSSTIKKRKT